MLQAQEDVSKNLLLIKNLLYGSSESEPQTDIVVAQVAQEFYNSNLLYSLVCNLNKIDFEVSGGVAAAEFWRAPAKSDFPKWGLRMWSISTELKAEHNEQNKN